MPGMRDIEMLYLYVPEEGGKGEAQRAFLRRLDKLMWDMRGEGINVSLKDEPSTSGSELTVNGQRVAEIIRDLMEVDPCEGCEDRGHECDCNIETWDGEHIEDIPESWLQTAIARKIWGR